MSNVKETTEVVDGILALIDAVEKSMVDGKINIADVANLIPVIPMVQPALDGIALVPSELSQLSAEDAAALVAHVMAKLSIDDAKAQLVIGKALNAGVAVFELVKAIKS